MLVGGVLLAPVALFWYLRTPVPIVSRVESLGGTVGSSFTFNYEEVDEALGLRRLAVVTQVFVESDEFSDEDVKALSQLDRITTLEVSSALVTDAGIAELDNLQYISSIRINCRNVTDDGLSILASMESLDYVDIMAGAGVKGTFIGHFNKRPSIRELCLHGRHLGDEVVTLITELPDIERLDLSGSGVTDQGIMGLEVMPKLKYVKVDNTFVTSSGISKLKQRLPQVIVSPKN